MQQASAQALVNEPTDATFSTVNRVVSAQPNSSIRTSYIQKARHHKQLKSGSLGGDMSIGGQRTRSALRSNDTTLTNGNMQNVSISMLSIPPNRSSAQMQAMSGSKLASLRPVNVCSQIKYHKHGHSYYTSMEAAKQIRKQEALMQKQRQREKKESRSPDLREVSSLDSNYMRNSPQPE